MLSVNAYSTAEFGTISHLLQAAFQVDASDIHLKAGAIPMFRIDGDLRQVEFPALEPDELEKLCCLLSGKSADQLTDVHHLEFSYHWPGVGRFRGNFYKQQDKPALALRPIPLKVPTMNELRLPGAAKRICGLTQGLVLITGATGMGKTTTLACLLENIGKMSCRHIITIEDPIEYLIEDGSSFVTQREIGRDVVDFHEGLCSALRQDPDVIFIGEARDRETMEVALHASLSGHLVFTSAHFSDAAATINGIIGMADPKEQINWRFRLADALRAIISQRLLPRKGAQGRVLATEVLMNEPTVRSCILDESRMKGIKACIERGKNEYQTHTMDQCLLDLVQMGLISIETAQSAATSPGDLMREVTLRRIPT